MKPSASAPASTAVIASRRFVMPQTLTRIMNNGGGETPPPFPPRPARGDSARPHPPRLARAHVLVPPPPRPPAPASRPPRPSPRRLDRSQLADLCRDVGRRDERLAHQHGVGSGHSHTLHLVAGKEPALADDDVARGNPGQQLERRLDPRLERRQVTVVDADDA